MPARSISSQRTCSVVTNGVFAGMRGIYPWPSHPARIQERERNFRSCGGLENSRRNLPVTTTFLGASRMSERNGAIKPIAIYHEHPDWFRPLFAELDRRSVPYERLDAASHTYDPS